MRMITGPLRGTLLVLLPLLAPFACGSEYLIDVPELAIANSDFRISATVPSRELSSDHRLVVAGDSYLPDSLSSSTLTFSSVTISSTGTHSVKLLRGETEIKQQSIRVIPGWFTIVPPALTIIVALVFRSVIPALFLGIAVGAWGVIGFTPEGFLRAVARTFETYVKESLLQPEHATVILFTMMTAGMIGILSRNGGISGLVRLLTRWASTPRRGMLCSTGLGDCHILR